MIDVCDRLFVFLCEGSMLRSLPSIPQRFVLLVALGGMFAFGDGAPAGHFQRPPGLTCDSGILAEWRTGAGPTRRKFDATGWDADAAGSSEVLPWWKMQIFKGSLNKFWSLRSRTHTTSFVSSKWCPAFVPSTTQNLPNTHLLRTVVANFVVEHIWRAKHRQQLTRWDDLYKYIYIYNHSRRWPYKTTAIKYMSPPAQLRLICAQGRDYTYYIMQARFHRNIAASSLAADCNVPQRPPAVIRSFTSIQMAHTHTDTLPQQGGWNGHEDEMTMNMRWHLT